MNNISNKIKILIITIIFLCGICIVALYVLGKKEEEEIKIDDNGYTIGDSKQIQYNVEKLKDPTKFFSIEDCIKKEVDENFVAKDMNILQGERIYNYSVYGTIGSEKVYFIIRIDIENMTFLMENISNKNYDTIDQINLETNIKEIKNDGKNDFEFKSFTDEAICRYYLNKFTKLEIENPQESYSLLEEEYKKERFPNFEEYKEYVEAYQNIIKEAILSQYSVEHYDDYTEYVLVDNYNTSYLLKATSVMNYTIRLDNYTIKTKEYENDYKKIKNENKVQSNVYIFLQMINTKDYKHAYNLLNETFKSNNFGTLAEFKEYVKNNFFDYNLNTASEVDIKQEGNYYVYETLIRNNSGSAAQSKKLTVIMQLLEGTNFVMSFNIGGDS